MKGLFALSAVLAMSCSDKTQNAPTQLNLDRPVDISFACYGGLRVTNGGAASADQPIVSTAQPIEGCNVRSGARDASGNTPRPPGQEDLVGSVVGTATYFAFILQSGPGTVALAQFDTKPSSSFAGSDVLVLDADELTPGKNSITVGEDPVAIATDRVGCYEVIANRGSCDLSVLDINSVFQNDAPGEDPVVSRLAVKNATGQPINARPAAMVAEPPGGTIGTECPATATGLVYVAYPSCHLVAGIDVSTGTIVTGVTFDANGVPTITDGNVSCPDECAGGSGVVPGFRPTVLDIDVDARSGRRLLSIAADSSNLVTLYDLDLNNRPITVSQVALQNTTGRLAVSSLAISPLIGIGGSTGTNNDGLSTVGDRQFLYAVVNDGTVRVADITSTTPRECDAQVDPRYIRDLRDVAALACFTVGDAATPPRRAGARGPGIELVADAVPTSVEVFRIEDSAADSSGPDRMIGHFGVITSTDGRSFVFNIDDDDAPDFVTENPIGSQIPLVIPHQLRDDIVSRALLAEEGGELVCDDDGPDPDSQNGNAGGARLAGSIVRTIPVGTLAAEKLGGTPTIRQVLCDAGSASEEDRPVSELFFGAPLSVRESVFPDLRGLRNDENWTMTWEGSLSLDSTTTAVDGPPVRQSQMFVDGAGLRMVDASRPFCETGVEPYDVLQLRGCDPSLGNAGCPTGYTCFVHPQSQVAGLGACMLADEAERLANACRSFLTSLRRFTVGRTRSGELQLLPRKHVLRTTPLTGCTDDTQCQSLARYALTNASSTNPFEDQTPDDTRTYGCHADPDRRPLLGTGGQPLKRCIMTCEDLEQSSDCTAGTVCVANPAAAPKPGYCMESVTPPQSCVNAPQRYELRAGDAFSLIGSRTGFTHPIIADGGGNCVRDPNANPYLVGRVPLSAPACDPTADARTGRRVDGTFEPNPCELTVDQSEYQVRYEGETCELATPDEALVTRPTTGIRLRHRAMTLTLVDPTYQGDLRCHGDRAGALVEVPLVSPGYQLAFRQTAGFAPKSLRGIVPSFPIKVTRGPGESIWIIDEGDFLSTSITQASTRGKVYRIESRSLGVINLLE